MKKLYLLVITTISCISPILCNTPTETNDQYSQTTLSACQDERIDILMKIIQKQQEQIARQEEYHAEILQQHKRQSQLLNIIALPIAQREQQLKARQQQQQVEQEEWDAKPWYAKVGIITADLGTAISSFYIQNVLLPDLINRGGQRVNRELFRWTDDQGVKINGKRLGELLGYTSREDHITRQAKKHAHESATNSQKPLTDEELEKLLTSEILNEQERNRTEFHRRFPHAQEPGKKNDSLIPLTRTTSESQVD